MQALEISRGPWALEKDDNDIYKSVVAADGRTIASVEESDTPEKVWGNAFLLSNADRLYEASVALREAQKAYMADRGNQDKGLRVAECATNLDQVLDLIRGE